MLEMKNVRQNLKRFLVIRDSIQDKKVNSILDKVLLGRKLDKEETQFLDKFEEIINLELKDYSHLSKNMIVEVLKSLLNKKIKVICDLTDRDGKIGEEILSIDNKFSENSCKLLLKNKSEIELSDRFLYNLLYNLNKHEYSLTIQDEYFEKIFIEKNED